MVSTTPAFNLKVVLKETGLTADTLRAWERRYGLPVPQRTAGGHRLYSQRDIETIKWLMKCQAEGLSISRAVDLWNEQLASGTDPLAGTTPSTLVPTSSVPVQHQSSDTTLDSLRADWIEACLSFSESTAEQTLNQAFSIFPVEVVCIEVLQKGISEIGDLWYENRASVQQEHFASGLAMRRLDALMSASPAPTRKQTVFVGCPPDEWHTLTPLLISLLLRRRGLDVLYFGANIPVAQFSDTVKNVKANLVVLAAQQLTSAATLQRSALMLSSQKIPVAFGGRIFNLNSDLPDAIPGYFLGQELYRALEEIELILNGNLKPHQAKVASQIYGAAHQAFVSRRAQIEMKTKESLELLSLSPENIGIAMYFMGENIAAALQLGNMSFVSAELDWLQGLLQARSSPATQLASFLQTYSNAITEVTQRQGEPISEWFATALHNFKT
ncbi:MAG TPA: MerR family transcriptional regulator [Anaerolineales bacterium]|nr:MerR family transcriptional regulator [Anaerolineales bacterium]